VCRACQTEASCVRCKNVKDGPYCVPECPRTKYPDDSGICQDCHENCESYGCTGSLNSVGYGACNACDIAVYDKNNNATMCLPLDAECEDGYFKHLHLTPKYGPMAGKKVSVHILYTTAS